MSKRLVINNQIEFLNEWIKRLRSGDYEQTTGVLRRKTPLGVAGPDKFCAIGVACEVGRDIGMLERRLLPNGYSYEYAKPRSFSGSEPNSVGFPFSLQTWLNVGSIYSGNDLVELNDVRNWTFEEIADYLETQIKPMYVLHFTQAEEAKAALKEKLEADKLDESTEQENDGESA